jgi:hypothetical protein
MTAVRKSRQSFPRRLLPLHCVCLDVFCDIGRSRAALPLDARPQRQRRCVASMSGPTIPDAEMVSLAITLIKQRCCPKRHHWCSKFISAFGGTADMAGLGAGSTRSRMTHGGRSDLHPVRWFRFWEWSLLTYGSINELRGALTEPFKKP